MERQRRRNGRVPRYMSWLCRTIVTVLLFTVPASSQFIVQPMKIELAPRAGQKLAVDLTLQNTSVNQTHIIDLQLLDLVQLENNEWEVAEPGSNFDTSNLSSCKDWMRLRQESVRVGPLNTVNVTLGMVVPRSARGFYAAAVVATLRQRLEVRGVGVILQMLVPVLVHIQGWAPRHEVELTDVGLRFEELPEQPATSVVTLGVANRGRSFSRLNGMVRVSHLSGDRQLKITDAEYIDVGIIPGVQLALERDIQRSLPSGKYKLEASLFVDGRRAKPLVKEIDLVGDPKLSRAAADAALDLRPAEVSVETVPGATRTGVLRVHNASSDEVNVRTAVVLPPVLDGVSLGETGLRGEDLNCAPWVEVRPKEFSLRARGSQNLQIITRMPNPTSTHACYYALLRLFASYVDGQSAGIRSAYVCVTNKRAQPEPSAQVWALTLEREADSKYVVKSTFMNTGNVHFTPTCKAVLTTPDNVPWREVALSGGRASVMLPLEPRVFSEVIDFAGLRPGIYRLTATLQLGSGGEISTAVPIQIEEQGEQKVATVITSEDYERTVGVTW